MSQNGIIFMSFFHILIKVVEKETTKTKRRTDEDFLERLEQVQLAEE